MPYSFSDHFTVTALSSAIDSTQTTITVDTLTSAFADDVQAGGEYPLRLGGSNRATHERVLVTGIADEANNQLTVERGVEFGAESHSAGARVAHALPAGPASRAAVHDEDLADLENTDQMLEAAIEDLDARLTWLTDTQSSDGSTKIFTISHPLSSAPQVALVQPESVDAEKDFFVSGKTASDIEITYQQAPPSGTDNLTWGVLVGFGE